MYIIEKRFKRVDIIEGEGIAGIVKFEQTFFLILKCTMSFGERHVTFILWCFGIYTISKKFEVINVIKDLKNWKKI